MARNSLSGSLFDLGSGLVDHAIAGADQSRSGDLGVDEFSADRQSRAAQRIAVHDRRRPGAADEARQDDDIDLVDEARP